MPVITFNCSLTPTHRSTHPHPISSHPEGNKAVHLQRSCPVCQGTGRVVSRRKARATAIEGVITSGRRPPGFVVKGPVPPPERIEAAKPESGEALCYLTGTHFRQSNQTHSIDP